MAEKDSDGIVTLTLNRHKGRNSFSRAFLSSLVEATEAFAGDAEVRALILRSTVPKVFCAGADLKERATMSEDEVEAFVASLRDGVTNFAKLPFPTIAAIEGAALGGGMELALGADFRVCSKSSLLGLPECQLAIIPGAGGSQRLPRVVGMAKAKEMIFLGQRLSGEEAAAIGLVTECVEDGRAEERAREMALHIARTCGPLGIRQAKDAMTRGMESPSLDAALQIERECYSKIIGTADRIEGLTAFKEKRAPQYQGR